MSDKSEYVNRTLNMKQADACVALPSCERDRTDDAPLQTDVTSINMFLRV